jgi:hypothetical protein
LSNYALPCIPPSHHTLKVNEERDRWRNPLDYNSIATINTMQKRGEGKK